MGLRGKKLENSIYIEAVNVYNVNYFLFAL